MKVKDLKNFVHGPSWSCGTKHVVEVGGYHVSTYCKGIVGHLLLMSPIPLVDRTTPLKFSMNNTFDYFSCVFSFLDKKLLSKSYADGEAKINRLPFSL